MRRLEDLWNAHAKNCNKSFGARPTRQKMPDDYDRQISAAVVSGRLQPYVNLVDSQLLFAYVCGTRLGFRGGKEHYTVLFSEFRTYVLPNNDPDYPGWKCLFYEAENSRDKTHRITATKPTVHDASRVKKLYDNPNDPVKPDEFLCQSALENQECIYHYKANEKKKLKYGQLGHSKDIVMDDVKRM